jgi:cation:H+ antiporter
MSNGLLAAAFFLAATLSLATSWLLVSRLERVGARLGLTEALLGMLAALAADAPEITSAVSAMLGGHTKIGAGVVLGSNVFNLAALLGLGALIAGRIALHRRVILVESVVALGIGAVCLLVVLGVLAPPAGLVLALVLLLPYLLLLGVPHDRLARAGLPDA